MCAPDRAWRIALWCGYRVLLVYWYVFRPVEPSAHVALWRDGRILVVKPSYCRYLSMPAGRIERGETPRHAARRELGEEVGLDVKVSQLREVGMFVSRQQWKEDRGHVFELEGEVGGPIVIDRREIIAAWFEQPEQLVGGQVSAVLQRYLETRIQLRYQVFQ